MKPYRLHEADIQVPDDWQDGTINTFSLEGAGGKSAANFVVTRDPKTKVADVQAYADQQLVTAAKHLKGYELTERRLTQVSGQQAVEVDFTWKTPERIEIQQRQAYLQWGELFVIFTLTAKKADFRQHEGVWEEIVQSVQVREP